MFWIRWKVPDNIILWQDVGPCCEQTHAAFEVVLSLDQGQGVYSGWPDVDGSSQLRLCHTCIIDVMQIWWANSLGAFPSLINFGSHSTEFLPFPGLLTCRSSSFHLFGLSSNLVGQLVMGIPKPKSLLVKLQGFPVLASDWMSSFHILADIVVDRIEIKFGKQIH